MFRTSVSLFGRWDEALPDGCKLVRGRSGRFRWMVAITSLALAIGGLAAAKAQVPGPESFAQEPQTPMELWSAIDYLVRTGQIKQAVPYLNKLMSSQLDDATLIQIRDKFGTGSILRLEDDPATRKYAQPLVEKLTEAARRHAIHPDRIARFVAALSKSTEEQEYAVARLREAGPDAVPFLVDALDRAGIPAEERALLARNMGRLDRTAVPALLAVLDSPDAQLAVDAATALGRIGDPRAVPFLTYPAAAAETPPAVRQAAREAIARLTGKPFASQPRTPAKVLTDAARSFHRHQVEFPGDPVVIWTWDNNRKAPVPRQVSRSDAEALLGLRLARQALRLEPRNFDAQVVLVSVALEKAIERVGFSAFPAGDQATFAMAVAAGPRVLGEVLHEAIADGKTDLAAAAATALGQVTDRALLSSGGHPHPLVEALGAPGARLQFAAAKALVDIAPTQPFPGSSRIVPTLARFANTQSLPRAMVIDSNPTRGSKLAGFLRTLGYEAVLETTGDRGFREAVETADVELVLISHDLFQGAWGLVDTLTNFQTDARTANVPVYVYGPLNLTTNRPNLLTSFPRVKYLVQPVDAASLERLLGGKPAKLTDAERTSYAQEATSLLARIASQPNSPLAADLTAAEPALAAGLRTPGTSLAASTALGDVADPSAQRSLADTVLDPSRPIELRRASATQLARSIQRFGPLIAADQETRLASEFRTEEDPQLRVALGTVIGLLRARSEAAQRAPKTARPATSPGSSSTSSPVSPAARSPNP
jgi:HEAT repeat protein